MRLTQTPVYAIRAHPRGRLAPLRCPLRTALRGHRPQLARLAPWTLASEKKKPRLGEARRGQSKVSRYLLASVVPRFHTDSDLPPEAGAGLIIVS
jgi:hypothetical protein